MKTALIWAMARNRVIGRDNQLPWHLPGDLQYFKGVTLGKPVIMGRKTFESIGRPLPGRTNIVITRDVEWQHEGVVIVHSVEEAITAARTQAVSDGVDEIIIMGGAEIYRQTLSIADRLYITLVEAEPEGDAWFPEFSLEDWQEESREEHLGGHEDSFSFSYLVYSRGV